MAYQALQAQGFGGQHAAGILNAALPAAAQAMRGAARGDRSNLPSLSDSNYVMNFTAAAFSGLIRGQGFAGSAIDGFQGVVGGYVAQVLAARFGLPKRTAGVLGAIVTPLAIDFLWEKLEQQTGDVAAQAAAPAAAAPAALPPAQAGYGYGYYQQQQAYGAPGHALPQAGYGQAAYGQPGHAHAGYGHAGYGHAPPQPAAHPAYGHAPAPAHHPGYGPPPAASPNHAAAPAGYGHGGYSAPSAQYTYNPYERR